MLVNRLTDTELLEAYDHNIRGLAAEPSWGRYGVFYRLALKEIEPELMARGIHPKVNRGPISDNLRAHLDRFLRSTVSDWYLARFGPGHCAWRARPLPTRSESLTAETEYQRACAALNP